MGSVASREQLDSLFSIVDGTANDRLACADAGYTTPVPPMNERPESASRPKAGNDPNWVSAGAKLAAALDQISPFSRTRLNVRARRNLPSVYV